VQVLVIGAGVIGLSVATELAHRGARVTVVEAETPGTGTSASSYAWVNANNKRPVNYYELNLAGVQAHHRLMHDEDGDWLVPTGHVEVATDTAHQQELQERLTRLQDLGYQAEELTPQQAHDLIPDLIIASPNATIGYYPQEAYCLTQSYLTFLLHRADRLGVQIITETRVDGFNSDGPQVQVDLSNGLTVTADHVVSCAGRWTQTVAQHAGTTVPMMKFEHPGDPTVGYLAVTNPLSVPLNRLVTTSQLNIRPDGQGRLLLQALDLDIDADPSAVPALDSPLAAELVTRLQNVLTRTDDAAITQLQVGQRALPIDGQTVAGPIPNMPWLYVVATHSGITLAPLLGASVAAEIYGTPQDLLTDFRPDRFLSDTGVTATPVPPRRPGQQ